MVYEVKCDNCGDVLDFGGHDPEEQPIPREKLPENAVEFDGNVYCEECVRSFVEAGVGEVMDKVDFLKSEVDDIKKELGMEKGLNQ